MRQIVIFLFIALFNGCCWNGTNIGTRDFGRTIEKTNTLTLAISKINPSTKAIELGMSKEQVLEAWGKPDWYGPWEDNEWFYSNVKKSNVEHPVTYDILFENGKVLKIIEDLWSEQKWMCHTSDL